ncbi:serine hydrolase [Algoriphagus sp. A40]|uniref:serine hydrolase domain-containing protein n=1 Tax=Algoriphagus sp. A40 TaxID=1945863 RepID=UPI00098745C3|nr:serine hydrolase domain-containing protein [Algoriphagus sp. A40]OOG70617.1 serine hydrolase [Algoriphagus sp. A40]
MKTQTFFSTSLRWLSAFLLLILISCSDSSDPDPTPPADKQEDIAVIDGKLEAFLTTHKIPGATLAISKNGKLVYKKPYGLANVEANEKMTNEHRMRVASVSKTFAGLAIMKLVQDGKISLDDKVFGPGTILGTTYGTKAYSDRVTKVTVRHLMQMTTGGWVVAGNRDAIDYQTNLTNDQFFSWMMDNATLTFEPGSQYYYVNTNYFVASRIVEKISGKSYYQYMKESFIDPIGIPSTVMAKNGIAGKQSDEVTYYGQGGTKGFEYNLNIERRDGDAGIVINAVDLLKFSLAIDGNPSRPDVLNAATFAQFVQGSSANQGFGNGIVTWNSVRYFYGALPGTRSSYMYHTSNGMAVALIFNGNADYTANTYNTFAIAHQDLLLDLLNNNLNVYKDIDQF